MGLISPKSASQSVNSANIKITIWNQKTGSCFSVIQSCPILHDPMDCSMPGFPALHYLPEFAQTHKALMPPNHLILCHPLLLLLLQTFPVSGSFAINWLFTSRWSKYWSFSISPSNDYSGWKLRYNF